MALDPIYHGYRPGPSIPDRSNPLLAILAGAMQGRGAKVQEDQRQKNAMLAGSLPSLISQGYDPSALLGVNYSPMQTDTPWGRMPIGMAERKAQIEKDIASAGMSMDELSTPEGIAKYKEALSALSEVVGDDPLASGSVGAGGKVRLSYGQDPAAMAVNKMATMIQAARSGTLQGRTNVASDPSQIYPPEVEGRIASIMRKNNLKGQDGRKKAIAWLLSQENSK